MLTESEIQAVDTLPRLEDLRGALSLSQFSTGPLLRNSRHSALWTPHQPALSVACFACAACCSIACLGATCCGAVVCCAHLSHVICGIGGDQSNAQELLKKTAVLKLNGGLGTSMGLEKAKSLLVVKDGLTFLDLIARQARHI